MKYTITSPETESLLATVEHDENREGAHWVVVLAGEKGEERRLPLPGAVATLVGGQLEVRLKGADGEREVFPVVHHPASGVFTVATALGNLRLLAVRGAGPGAGSGGRAGARALKSSMPGKVLKLLCGKGDVVESGQPLLIIEAMKMENEIRSPQAGRIEEIGVQAGQSVSTGDLLVKIGSAEKA